MALKAKQLLNLQMPYRPEPTNVLALIPEIGPLHQLVQ